MKFTEKQEHTLLNIAEWSIHHYVESGRRNSLPSEFREDPELQQKLGVFVSVYIAGELRGCIGTFSESVSLSENTRNMAIQAASEDRRFKPIEKHELPELDVEISVLSRRRKISGPDEIEIGKHGVYLVHDIRRATLLPQVAVKYDFTPVEFLECCAKNKLGLRADSWKDSDIYVYEAIVIS